MDSILMVGDSTPTISSDFVAKLKAFDPDLFVSWSPSRRRFVIEQCTQHLSHSAEHNHLCRKSYVWMVQDEEKSMLPLGEHVFDHLKKMRANTESFGGPTERGLRNFRDYTGKLSIELKEKADRDMREVARLNSLDNKIQLNKVRTMIGNMGTPNR